MSKLLNLYMQDMKLLLRYSFTWLMVGTILIFLSMYHFMLSDTVEHDQTMYFVDDSAGSIVEVALTGENAENIVFVNSIEELEELILEKETQVGIVFSGTMQEPKFTIVHGETMRQENVNLIGALLKNMILNMGGVSMDEEYSIKFLEHRTEPIPQNKMSLPLILTYEVVFFSFFLSAVFIFQEKAEGSTRAYRVAPAGTAVYIVSKTLVYITKGVVYGTLLLLLTIGPRVNFLLLIPVMALGISLFTFLSMSIATYYSNISEWVLVGMMGMIVGALPIFTILIPTFSPFYIEWIPSFPVLYSFREILFPSGLDLSRQIFHLIGFNVVAYIICHLLVSKKLMKEGV
ncbi:MAG: ABC transporter permease [Clostridiales bacterium]|nr:ABC transporter permease [Clostridiales bacterium]